MTKDSADTHALVHENFLIKFSRDQFPPTKVRCRWEHDEENDGSEFFSALDLRISVLPATYEGVFEDATSTALETLIRSIWGRKHLPALDAARETFTTVLLVPHGRQGFICRSDMLSLRLGQSRSVERIVPFATWDTHLSALPVDLRMKNRLLSLLPSSPGVLVLRQPHDKAILNDLNARLSFNWLLSSKPAARRVAVISGRPFPDKKRQMYSSQGYFNAARALGISLVVVDDPGHWLEDDAHSTLRDEFVPINMDYDNLASLPQRLFEALKDKKLDGIVTFWDAYVVQTAKAAELLGLPTESYAAMRQAHLKHEMRSLTAQNNIQALVIDSVEQLSDPSRVENLRNLQYPLVVKPCRGRKSENVKKVTDESSMQQVVRSMFKDTSTQGQRSGDYSVLLETYIDGPEFDANFMLWNDKIMFLEVTDSYPCAADASDATFVDPFRETVQMSHTQLPSSEVDIIRSSLHRNLLKLGFHSGVFHVEARMRNSSLRYQDVRGDGILDLDVNDETASDPRGEVDVFLVEVNARPPGTGGTWTTLFAYGVDFGALHFLRALGDSDRIESLSRPFNFPEGSPGGGGGTQYWTAQCLVPIHRRDLYVRDDLWERVYLELPEVEPYVLRAEMYVSPGTIVSNVMGVEFLGYVLLYSRASRRHALEMYHQVVKTCVKVLDEKTSQLDA